MKTEEELRERIAELESRYDPEGDAYLDEGEQSELSILYWVLEEGDY